MLAEIDVSSNHEHENGSHAVKRRRIGATEISQNLQDSDPGSKVSRAEHLSKTPVHDQGHESSANYQTVYASSSDGSEFEDVDWEEVAFEGDDDSDQNDDPLDLTLKFTGKPSRAIHERKRKPITAAERVVRVNVHKMHLLCLIAHLRIRNVWCNDGQVQVSQDALELINQN